MGLRRLLFEWGSFSNKHVSFSKDAFRCYILISAQPMSEFIDSITNGSNASWSKLSTGPVWAALSFCLWVLYFLLEASEVLTFIPKRNYFHFKPWRPRLVPAVKKKPVWRISSDPSAGAPGQRLLFWLFFVCSRTFQQKLTLKVCRSKLLTWDLSWLVDVWIN